jgi:flagellar motor protein MotB
MRLASLIIFSFCISFLFSQSVITKKDAPKQSLKLFLNGVEQYRANQYAKAISLFEKALQKTPNFIDAELQWASVCFEMKNYECAEIHFQKVLALDSTYNSKVYYTLSLTQYQLDHFKQAKENCTTYLRKESANQDLIAKAKLLLKYTTFADSATRNPVPIVPTLLKSFNSDYSEYMPTISADGKTAVFTRRTVRNDEDLFISHFIDSSWTEAIPISDLNTPANEGSPALSPDGTSLIFTICDGPFSFGGCDLYLSELKDGHWTKPYNMGEKINTPAYESNACFAENGNAIYFTSNRKGTLGGNDIWMSRRKKDHSWSVPKNLGPTINTSGNELSPFIHPNGKVLYFSSDYFPGMGGRDLFYSIADENGNWDPPVNLGYPINSKGDESSFVVFPDGQKAWMASDKKYLNQSIPNQHPNLDLYEMILPASLSIPSSTYIELTVSDKLTDAGISATVSIFDLSNNKVFYENTIDSSGKLLIALPTGADYGMHIYHKDYLFISDQFRCTVPKKIYNPFIIHKKMERVSDQNNVPVSLKNILFESGTANLKKESRFELMALVQFLNDNPQLKLKITGHTDNIGTEADNQILSEKRASAVVDFLKQKGIAMERLIHEGKGETMPVDDNNTEEGRQNNRRIEFLIIK